jgi:hypothetical protein
VRHLERVDAGPQDGTVARRAPAAAAAGLAAAARDRRPAAVLALQSAVGNRATRRLCEDLPGHASSRSSVHTSSSATRTRDDDVVSPGLREAVLARQSVAPTCPAPPQMSEAERAATMAALCIGGDEIFTGAPVVEFTPRERRLVTATLLAARSKAAQATNNLSRGDRYMTTLAARFFHEDGLDQNELAATAHRIHEALMSTPIERGTCASQLCTREVDGRREGSAIMADADVDHLTHTTDTITICPFFFDRSHSVTELVRTWLHEAGHIARIDDPPPGQRYQHPPNCETQRGGMPGCAAPYEARNACPGGDRHNVDNWAYFIDHAASA